MTQTLKAIILASSSSYRAKLLQQILPQFECISPDIDESMQTNENAEQLALRLSIEKAQAVAASVAKAAIIIASDQVASLDGIILNKPLSHHRATEQLRAQSGRTVTFHTGLCLINTSNGKIYSSVENYAVQFKTLNDKQIEHYLLRDVPYDCAGSFKAESLGIALFEKMQGDDPNSLIGLPLIRLSQWLTEEGIDPLLL